MKVLFIQGSPHAKGCTYTALKEVADTLEKNGIAADLYWIGTKPIPGCVSCGHCEKTDRCVFAEDGVNQILDHLDEYNGIVVGSPVYYSGPDGQLCAFLDRLFYAAGSRMNGKVAAAVVSCRRGGASASFERLNQYFLMNNMIVIGSQYWNQVHGFTPGDVKQDLEGLQTMRTLGQNMAWILKCIEAGKAQGIDEPVYENPVMTNFIMPGFAKE